MHAKCIPHFDKLLYTFCIQNLTGIALLIFVYKMYTKVCRNVVHILYTPVVYILYKFCIQNVYTVSMWGDI